jgi:exopolysaccharide biosynthesis polyprenyl glycosylphosphotransferase
MDDGGDREVAAAPLSVVRGDHDDALTPVPAAPRMVLPVDWLPIVLLAGDGLIAAASVCVAYWLRTVGFTPAARLQQFGPYLDRVPLVVGVCACALALNGQYRSWRGSQLGDQLFRLCSGIGLALLLLLSLGAVTHTIDGYSRYAITYAAGLSAVAMVVERVILRTQETRLRQRGVGTERVLLIGAGDACEVLLQRMTMFPELGYTVCAVVDDERVVRRPAELARLVQGLAVDTCILALPSAHRDRLAELVRQCTEQRIEFRLVPDLLEVTSTRARAELVDGLPLVGVSPGRIGSPSWAGKRLIDVAVASGALVLTAPLLIAIAAAIHYTAPGGPVLSRQVRVGRFGRPFTAFRFQTAAPDDTRIVALRGREEATPVGQILRRTGLDRLPVLVNVLRGDMSLVGPSPQPAQLDDRYRTEVPRYRERHRVRPGLVGWAEANDVAGSARVLDRTRYDVYYVENWSLAMDLRIVLLTATRFGRHRQAT